MDCQDLLPIYIYRLLLKCCFVSLDPRITDVGQLQPMDQWCLQIETLNGVGQCSWFASLFHADDTFNKKTMSKLMAIDFNMYVYIYIHVYMYVDVCVYVYIYIDIYTDIVIWYIHSCCTSRAGCFVAVVVVVVVVAVVVVVVVGGGGGGGGGGGSGGVCCPAPGPCNCFFCSRSPCCPTDEAISVLQLYLCLYVLTCSYVLMIFT